MGAFEELITKKRKKTRAKILAEEAQEVKTLQDKILAYHDLPAEELDALQELIKRNTDKDLPTDKPKAGAVHHQALNPEDSGPKEETKARVAEEEKKRQEEMKKASKKAQEEKKKAPSAEEEKKAPSAEENKAHSAAEEQ